ncbi:MAG: hypothetical protein IKT58_01140 [Oscillospiraceae bacterium]|nr:hypothetical protein [Oscillospiraceae bacterium]
MSQQATLTEHLQILVGKQLDTLNTACDMMMFGFGAYALHAQCLVRIICENDILVTTADHQSWDGEAEENNDEQYFVEQYKDNIIGGTVTSVKVNALHDVVILLDNGIRIELFINSGHHHFAEEAEQWVFFKPKDHSYPFITVYNKTIDIATTW